MFSLSSLLTVPRVSARRASSVRSLLLAGCVFTAALAGHAADAPEPSQDPMINLVRLLVQQGVLTQPQADALISQAEAQAQAAKGAAPAPAGTVRVTYVPDIVKKQLREDLKQEVMKQAREENWAAPRAFPEWTSRFRLHGDVRVRFEGDFFPEGNDNTGGFPNFNSLNTGSPYDASVSNINYPPLLNVDQDRRRLRLRARFGTDVDLGENFTAGLRLATGDGSSPVSTNQSLGASGGFSKYSVWLDRAFIQYERAGLTADFGRFDNPFFATDLLWDDDLGFDGLAVRYGVNRSGSFAPTLTLGAFPIYNTDFNYSSNRPDKFKSEDKWLYGAQIGADWKLTPKIGLKLGAAYYNFDNVEGRLSTAYTPQSSADAGDSDATRPAFAQKGNSYMALRNIIPDETNSYGTKNQWQYYGLATPYRELVLTSRIELKHFEPFWIGLEAEYVTNLAYDEGEIAVKTVNNRGAISPGETLGAFDGGSTGWTTRLTLGSRVLEQRWDWQLSFGYKYLESDAVVDGFTDSDFGLGGTNLEGYFIGGTIALSKGVTTRVRWLTADSLGGPPYQADVFQFDLNAKF